MPPENEAEVHSPLTESPEQVVSVGAVSKNDMLCLLFLCTAGKYFAHIEKLSDLKIQAYARHLQPLSKKNVFFMPHLL